MADDSKKVSELPTAANVAATDRILVLRDPAGNASVRTVNVNIFAANLTTVGGYVNANNLSANLANYQTTAGLSSNVATLTSNNSLRLGGVAANSYVTGTQLSSNLENYQTTAGLSSNVATLTANDSSYVGGIAAEEIKKYDVACWIANTISASEVVFGFTSVRSVRFAGNFANSKGLSLTASTGTYTMSVKKNGVDVGTITFSASNSATFATTGDANVDIVANDFISIVGNSTPDATLADISITLKGILI